MLGAGKQDFLMLCRETANVMMRMGQHWGHASGTRITLGCGDPSLALGPRRELEHIPVG